jgi:hypothetical protein
MTLSSYLSVLDFVTKAISKIATRGNLLLVPPMPVHEKMQQRARRRNDNQDEPIETGSSPGEQKQGEQHKTAHG